MWAEKKRMNVTIYQIRSPDHILRMLMLMCFQYEIHARCPWSCFRFPHHYLFWRSSIWINCSMPIISSSPPGGCGFTTEFITCTRNPNEYYDFCILQKWLNDESFRWKKTKNLFQLAQRKKPERELMSSHTFSCSARLYACFSASRALRSFNFSENMATDRARLIRLCLTRDFLAANSAANWILRAKRREMRKIVSKINSFSLPLA